MSDETPDSAASGKAPSQATIISEGKGFYAREATGFVREIGISGNVVLAMSIMSLGLAALVATQAPFAFAGANILLVCVLTAILALIPTLLYAMLGSAMPRSGGDFVFVSRILSPLWGFVTNFNMVIWWALTIAAFTALLAPYGLSATLATIGVATHNSGLIHDSVTVTSHNWSFAVGIIALIVVAAVMSLKTKIWMRVIFVVFGLTILGIVISIFVTGFTSRASFAAALPHYGASYGGIIKAAEKAGYKPHGFSFLASLLATPLAYSAFGYAYVATYWAGEVRSPRKQLLRGMFSALGIFAVLTFLLMIVAQHTFGQNFLGAAQYLSTDAPTKYPLPAPSFYFLFSAMTTTNSFLIVLMGISFSLTLLGFLPVMFLMGARCMFAWSFDRIIPDKVSSVNSRTHSPLVANGLVLVMMIVFLCLVVYGSSGFVQLAYTGEAGITVFFILVAFAGTVFPWRRPQMFEESPLGRSKIGKVPTITIVGILSMAVYLFFLLPLLLNSKLGANSDFGLWCIVVIALIPFPIYWISRALNARRGVDLKLAFLELPPE
jgi:amino acid transporter